MELESCPKQIALFILCFSDHISETMDDPLRSLIESFQNVTVAELPKFKPKHSKGKQKQPAFKVRPDQPFGTQRVLHRDGEINDSYLLKNITFEGLSNRHVASVLARLKNRRMEQSHKCHCQEIELREEEEEYDEQEEDELEQLELEDDELALIEDMMERIKNDDYEMQQKEMKQIDDSEEEEEGQLDDEIEDIWRTVAEQQEIETQREHEFNIQREMERQRYEEQLELVEQLLSKLTV